MLVEIYSDVVCPWCAIGKARFEKALSHLPEQQRNSLEVVWRPYQLDPGAPATPSPVLTTYAKKFGGVEEATRIIDRVTRVAADEGITFRMDIAQRANTFSAHRLIGKALQVGGPSLQHAVKQRFLDAYFVEGVDIGNHDELVRMVVPLRLFESDVDAHAFLDSSEGVAQTGNDIADGVERGVTAVPTFVFNGSWAVPGAQDPETFLRVFEKLFAKQAGKRAGEQAEEPAQEQAGEQAGEQIDAGETCAVVPGQPGEC